MKMTLYDMRGWLARDYQYPQVRPDGKAEVERAYAAKTVNVAQQTEKVITEKVPTVEKSNDPYSCYGKEMPNCILGSPRYWKRFGLDLISMMQTRGLADFFVTLSVNDSWPQVQATIKDTWGAAEKVENINCLHNREPVGGWIPRCLCDGCRGEVPMVHEYVVPLEQQGRTTGKGHCGL